MESIQVTPENLNSKATEVDNKAGDYFRDYQALLQDVETFTSSDWKGEDATAFLNKVREFEDDFNTMKTLMEKYAQFLRDAATNYTTTQDNLKSTIASLQG